MAVVNNQVILDEEYDESYEPTEQGITKIVHARHLIYKT